MSGRGAQDATNEVGALIAKFSAAGGKGDIDGCGAQQRTAPDVCHTVRLL